MSRPEGELAGSRRPRRENLPAQPTALIGRERDLAGIAALVRGGTRLVTLTGPGGAGKTRLGIAAAARLLDHFEEGVWLVELAGVSAADDVVPAIQTALGFDGQRGGEPGYGAAGAWLAARLDGRRALLLLDNFEQLTDAAGVVGEALEAAPGLSAIVTSRMPLRLPGEREWPVAPLGLPDVEERDPEVIAAAPAVRLFAARARAVQPAFQVTGETAPVVAAICRRLDGLPLAIELAAARSRALPPAAILGLLDERIALLSDGPRDLPGRHRTLEAAVAWSDDLLDPPDRDLFHRLAVFRAPWTGESARAIAAGTGVDLAAGISRLREHSLLQQSGGGEPRYRMLETVRVFAASRLADDSTAQNDARERHAAWFAALAERHENQAAALNRGGLFDLHLDDLLAAAGWYRETGREAAALTIAIRLGWYWYLRGRVALGARLLAGLEREDAGLAHDLRAAGLAILGVLRMSLGDHAAAARALTAAGALCRELGDAAGELDVREHQADLAMQLGDLAAARAIRADLLERRRRGGSAIEIASAMNNLAEVEQLDGAHHRALDLLVGALDACAWSDDWLTRRLIQGNFASLGAAMSCEGDPAAPPLALVREHCRESLAFSRDSGDAFGLLVNLLTAALLSAREEPLTAARLVGAAAAVSARSGMVISGVEAQRQELLLVRLAGTLGGEPLRAALAAGHALPEDTAALLALGQCA
ncbi:MAG: ATP-binding protein [Thermomicrobiales bacterium]